jgi:hypothetical protein
MENELGMNMHNDPGRMAVPKQLEPIEQEEQEMEGIQASGDASPRPSRKAGRPKKNQ